MLIPIAAIAVHEAPRDAEADRAECLRVARRLIKHLFVVPNREEIVVAHEAPEGLDFESNEQVEPGKWLL